MNCVICNNKVEQVDEKAVGVICSICVSKGWDFTKLGKETKEARKFPGARSTDRIGPRAPRIA